MKRIFLLLLLVFVLSNAAYAEYPDRQVTIVVPFPAGGPSDLAARVLTEGLSKRLGKPVIVENKVGATGIIGTQYVAKSAPDGYRLLLALSSHTINPSVFAHLPYDTLKDFTGVAMIVKSAFVLSVTPSIPAKNVRELLEYMKSHKVNYASSGIGSINHLGMELFKNLTHTDALHVPYQGAPPAMTALAGGQIQMMLTPVLTTLPMMKHGLIKGLAVTSTQRVQAASDLPTISEDVPGYELMTWFGIVAPAGTSKAIVSKLNTAFNETVSTPEVAAKLAEIGGDRTVPGTPESLDAFIRLEIAKWERIAQSAGVPRQ